MPSTKPQGPSDPTERVLNMGILSMALPDKRKTRDAIAAEAHEEILSTLAEHPGALDVLDIFVKYAPALGLRRLGRLLMKVASTVDHLEVGE